MVSIHCEDIISVNWKTDPAFESGTTTIWLLSLSQNHHLTDFLLNLLTGDEKARAIKYRREKDTKRYILTRATLRLLLAQYTNKSAEDIEFFYGEDKKPSLVTGSNTKVHFNVSHSNDFSLIVISNQPVGIDIEYINPDFNYLEILDDYSNSAEIREISQSPLPLNTFYKFWTRKEALLKATGKGIIDGLADISVLTGQNELDGTLIGSTANWSINSFDVFDNYVGSVATYANDISFIDIDLEKFQKRNVY